MRREGRRREGRKGEGGEGRGEKAFVVMWPRRLSALNPPLTIIRLRNNRHSTEGRAGVCRPIGELQLNEKIPDPAATEN